MTATAAQIGYNTLLQLGNGASPEVFTTVLEVKKIDRVGSTSAQVEATNLTSPNRTKEYVSGLQDGDTVTFTYNLITGNQVLMKAWYDGGVRSNWKVVLPGTLAARTFGATPASWGEGSFDPSGVLEGTIGLKIAGAIT